MAAPEVRIRNGDAMVKIRNPVTSALLPFVTFGIYGIFWYYYINRELADLGRNRGTNELGDSPGTSVLAVTLGALVIVPAILSYVGTAKRVEAAQRYANRPEPMSVGLAVVLLILLGPVGIWYIQNELNKVWETEAEPAPGEPGALPGESTEAPPAGAPGEAQPAERQQPPPPQQ
jgi:hypothetical protein